MNNNTPHKPRKSRHAKRHAAEQTEPFALTSWRRDHRNFAMIADFEARNRLMPTGWPNHWTNGCLVSMPGTPT